MPRKKIKSRNTRREKVVLDLTRPESGAGAGAGAGTSEMIAREELESVDKFDVKNFLMSSFRDKTDVAVYDLVERKPRLDMYLSLFLEQDKNVAVIPVNTAKIANSKSKEDIYNGLIVKKIASEDGTTSLDITYVDPSGGDMPRAMHEIINALDCKKETEKYLGNITGEPNSMLLPIFTPPPAFGSSPTSVTEVDLLTQQDLAKNKNHNLYTGYLLAEIVNTADKSLLEASLSRKSAEFLANAIQELNSLYFREQESSPRPDTSMSEMINRGSVDLTSMSKGRTSRRRNAPYRRLDSIARIITGGTVCAAVAFDGDDILYSNNKSVDYPHARDFFMLMRDIATYAAERKEHFPDSKVVLTKELNERLRILHDTVQEFAVKDVHRKCGDELERRVREKISLNRVSTDFDKVVSSLLSDNPKKMFQEGFLEAIMVGRVKFVSGVRKIVDKDTLETTENTLHAEMAILDDVIKNKKLRAKEDRPFEEFYLGISKLCCFDCHKAITALNRSAIEMDNKKVKEVVLTRGEHLTKYPWVAPNFLSDGVVGEVYSALSPLTKGKIATVHAADNSSSDPEQRVFSIAQKYGRDLREFDAEVPTVAPKVFKPKPRKGRASRG